MIINTKNIVMRKKHLLLSTLLFCGIGLFSSCTEEKDNPVPTPVVNEDRVVFENQFSRDLQTMADEFRFESLMQTTASVKEFISVLDEKALSEQILKVLGNVINGLKATTLDKLPEADQAAAAACLAARFDLTTEEMKALPGFFIVDAYNSIGKMKVEFKEGKCTITNDADAFTIVNTNAQGETKTMALTFNDERDGVRFFVTRLGNVPVAIQLPKSIGVTLTTPQGKIVNGTINLTTIDPSQSQFVNFKVSGWVADGKLTADVNNRQESVNLYVKHTETRAFDLQAAFEISGREMASMEIYDMHDEYTDEEINSDTFKDLRNMGPFFSGAYDVLKALRGKSVDKIVITMNDNMVIDGKVDDIAKSLLALGNVRKLQGTKPGKETIDKYTQELNAQIHFTVSQKNTGITAQATLLTAQKEMLDGEYQPVVALQFQGETEAKAMYDRMSQADMENYKKMFSSFNSLAKEIGGTLIVAREKGEAIASAVKGYFNNL